MPAVVIAVVAAAILFKTKRVPEPVLIVAAALVGIAAKSLAH